MLFVRLFAASFIAVLLFAVPVHSKDSFKELEIAAKKWDTFTPCEKAFAQGFAAYKADRLKTAERFFKECDGSCPVLQSYISEYLAKISSGGDRYHFVDGRKEITAEIESLQSAEQSNERDYKLAVDYFKLRNYSKAASMFEGLLVDNKYRLSALDYLATAQFRQDKRAEAIETSELVIKEYKQSKELAKKAYLRIASIYLDENNYGEARKAYEHLRKMFPQYKKGDVQWNIAWCAYKMGDLKSAAKQFQALVRVGGGDWRGRATYWQARALDEMGDKEKAAELFHQNVTKNPKSYYGMMSANKLDVEPDFSEVELKLTDDPKTSDMLETAIVLDKLGISELVAKELDRITTGKKRCNDRQKIFELALKNDAWSVIYRLGKSFPRAYPTVIGKLAKQNHIEPEFIWAILREESTFRQDVVSPAGAIGLMQIMPATGERMAKQKKGKFKAEDLFLAKQNIELGVRYLRFLLDHYKYNLYLTAAAYNAGEEAVDRWLGDVSKEPDNIENFVEEIPYKETQDYVRKVMKSYWTYKKLGDVSPSDARDKPLS